MQTIPVLKRAIPVFPTYSVNNKNIGSFLPFGFNFLSCSEPGLINVQVANSDFTELASPSVFLDAFNQANIEGGMYVNLYGSNPTSSTLFTVCARVLSVEYMYENVFKIQTDYYDISNTSEPSFLDIKAGTGMSSPFYVVAVNYQEVPDAEIDFISFGGDEILLFPISNGQATPCQLSVFGSQQPSQLTYRTQGWQFLMLW